nr:hypothetical protein pmam_413 [Pithovirus mammoth]
MSNLRTFSKRCSFPMCKTGFTNFNSVLNPEVLKFFPKNLSKINCKEEQCRLKREKISLVIEIKTKE